MSKHAAFEVGGNRRYDFCAECGEVMYLNRLTDKWAHAVKAGQLHDHLPTRLIATHYGESIRVVYGATSSAC